MRRSLWTIVCGVLFTCRAYGENPAIPIQIPIQAELLAHLSVRHVANGSTVFARVTADWSSDHCPLRSGAILEGKVEAAIPRFAGTHGSRLALAFTRAQCTNTDLEPFNLVLVAVAGIHGASIRHTSETQIPIKTFVSDPVNLDKSALGNDVGDLTSTRLELLGITHGFPARSHLDPGDVIDIKGLKLEVGTGPNRSSVLSTAHRDVALEKYTQLLLVPASVVFEPSAGPTAGSGAAGDLAPSPPAAPTPPPDNIEICELPGCAVDLPVSAEELVGQAAGSIAIGPLGYAPRMHNFEVDFDGEEALAWLGPQELLLAFNPHTLIRRSGIPKARAPVRVIRGILLDTSEHKVLQAVDWELADSGRYLWPLDGNRILVHVGNELRVYSSGLNVDARVPLAGPLAFIRISPNGQLMAVATLREQHSPELHSKLRDSSGGIEPEEPVDVLILNKNFKTIGSASASSSLLPPTLLNEGQVKLLAQSKSRYQLAMSTWENKSVTLARFESFCVPKLSSVAPDHLFLVTCNVNEMLYRVLRADGKLVLRRTSRPQDESLDAIGDAQNQLVAVKVVQNNQGMEPNTEEVRVYRSSDGEQLMAARVDVSPTNRGSFALSPDGLQLAVLSGTQIRLLSVPVQ
jgi:hypothetical protein